MSETPESENVTKLNHPQLDLPQQAATAIAQKKPDFKPEIAIILGSGLGDLVDLITDSTHMPYSDIPGFETCTVAGHKGQLILGYLHDVPVACLQGRPHYYEGAENQSFHTLIRSLKLLGCHTLLATNAAGSLREEVTPGSVVLVTDHINFHQRNPLIGPNDESFGPRFIGLEDLYNQNWRDKFKQVAREQNITLHEGVYLAVLGPVFETPAEIRAFKILGADMVGMSTVPEALVAHHCGMKVAAVSAITNLAAGLNPEILSHEITLKGAKLATEKLFKLILGVVSLK